MPCTSGERLRRADERRAEDLLKSSFRRALPSVELAGESDASSSRVAVTNRESEHGAKIDSDWRLIGGLIFGELHPSLGKR